MVNTQLGAVVRHIRRIGAAEGGRKMDEELLAAFAAGNDQAAFAGLVTRYGPLVLGVCRRVLRHEHDAEDAFQATFLVLARGAGAIRKRESLGSWLHGVAYRVAMRAKRQAELRRTHEGRARTVAPGDPAWKAAWQEVQVLLDEEIQELPEKCRAAFVLCCLDGVAQAEAARRLGVKEGTVWSRLAQARKLLKERLARRGVSLAALLAAGALTGRATAVPLALSASVASGAGAVPAGTVAAHVLALAKGVEKTMLLTTIKTSALLLLTASLLALGFGAALHPRAGAQPTEAQTPENSKALATPKAADAVEVSGQVLGPDGEPFAGAKLFLWTEDVKTKDDMPVRATTGPDGRFRFAAPKADLGRGAKLVAAAEGHGPDWKEPGKGDKFDEVTMKLVKDDVPIVGRILDLEGRPVAGAAVDVVRLSKRSDGDLAAWVGRQVARAKSRVHSYEQDGLDTLPAVAAGVPGAATTDKDGRFRLTGFGRDRVVRLEVRGPTIAHTSFRAATRAGPPRGWVEGDFALYASTFDHIAGPTKEFVGTVRDKRTGQPLAGVRVEGGPDHLARATTDAKGAYRLVGVPKGPNYLIAVGGGKGRPYFDANAHAADTPGLEPIRVDFALERGVEVTGRLTDKETGKPVPGAVMYFPLPDNPRLKDYTAFGGGVIISDWGKAGADGRFTVLAVPGPGALTAGAAEVNRYLPAATAGELRGLGVLSLPAATMHAVARLEVDENDPKPLTFAFARARSRTGSVVGPDGKPLAGAHVAGLRVGDEPRRLEGPGFVAEGLAAKRTRLLIFLHPEKKIGKVVAFPGDEEGALAVRLEPLGALAGRVVDADGKPLSELKVTAYPTVRGVYDNLPHELHAFQGGFGIAPAPWSKFTAREAVTGADGTFRFDGLLPGLVYDVHASRGDLAKPNTLVVSRRRVGVEAGKTSDLGDLKESAAPIP